MSRTCCCSASGCGQPEPIALNRREFIEALTIGAASLAAAGELAWAKASGDAQVPLAVPKRPKEWNYPITPPRVYQDKHLEAVAMPIGGIGTGSIWLDGRGRLSVWQIFNNLSEIRIPDSFFAVRVRSGGAGKSLDLPGGKPEVRVLQTVSEGPLKPVASLRYEGGYPIARLDFQAPDLPIQVRLEAFNPMIPLDTFNSSIPCAIFRLTARNTGQAPLAVDFLAALQNAVGSQGAAGIQGVKFGGYGGNVNRVVREKHWAAVAMSKSPDPVDPGPVVVRAADGRLVEGPEMLWLTGVADLTPQVVEPLARIAAEGGLVLADGIQPGFFKTIAALRGTENDTSALATVFADFESGSYEGWKLSGDAFGNAPSRGTEAGQQPVSGFAGRRLVNTFTAGDGPQGTATSRPFKIEKRYIGFLIGGGNHPGKTCINLLVDRKAVRTATGKNREALEPATWDVSEFLGKEAVIEIVDRESGGWGHINIDQIIFSDVPPDGVLRKGTAIYTVAQAVGLPLGDVESATLAAGQRVVLSKQAPAQLKSMADAWKVSGFTRLRGFRDGEKGYRVLAATPDGDPLIVEGPLGKGRIVLVLAPGLPWNWGSALLAALRGKPLGPGEQLVPGSPGWGTMALVAIDPNAACLPGWSKSEDLLTWFSSLPPIPAGTSAAEQSSPNEATSGPGETVNSALAVPMALKPGEQRTATFVIAWHFPNVQRFQHFGNLYNRRWFDAMGVARYVAENIEPLWEWTRLYHETLYQSNLPEEFLDAMTSQSCILRGPTCFWSEDGYFGGFEGSYGCCPLNCTHVWNYAQSHARLFPEVGRNMRISNFITFLHPSGETSHREHSPHNAFVDGHCACIVAALREHQLSPDRGFLETIWPGVKKAVDWLIEAIDKDRDGLPAGHQWNTYDTAVSGPNTFIGSQYLSALAAGTRMAHIMNDGEAAARWRAVLEVGKRNQNEKLWNGEYYIQIPEPRPARDYNNGCHADQLLGQWWAHMLDLGYLYPPDRVRGALEAVMKHNFRRTFHGFKQDPRRYVLDDEGGLLICTWPHNDRPKSFILYADEVWTGIEYSTAGAMIYEGLIEPARQIVRTARSRYDGRERRDLNSGPGGNPFNDLECGKFYARAMSSWSLLLACQGQVLDGPQGLLGFKPRWRPEDHRSFYTAPEGWGLFVQRRGERHQTERIEVRQGQLRLKELVFELPAGADRAAAQAMVAGRAVQLAARQDGREIRLTFEQPCVASEGEAIEITLRW
jgi:uncharacterized protein (DUF608 family)